MSLPESWVKRVFDKLTLVYGHRFLGRYSGIDLDAVREDWAHELRMYAQAPQAIKYALEHLPEGDPPTVLEFRALCNRRPHDPVPMLPPSKPDPEKARQAAEAVRGAFTSRQDTHAWAYALQERHARGETLTPAQIAAYKDALAEVPVEAIGGEFKAPPEKALPPGMRP